MPAMIHGPVVPLKPKETMMFRAFTAASLLALTVATAQAEPATGWRTHAPLSANDVCGSLLQSKAGSLFYRTWFNSCMRATSAEITRQAAKAEQHRAFASR